MSSTLLSLPLLIFVLLLAFPMPAAQNESDLPELIFVFQKRDVSEVDLAGDTPRLRLSDFQLFLQSDDSLTVEVLGLGSDIFETCHIKPDPPDPGTKVVPYTSTALELYPAERSWPDDVYVTYIYILSETKKLTADLTLRPHPQLRFLGDLEDVWECATEMIAGNSVEGQLARELLPDRWKEHAWFVALKITLSRKSQVRDQLRTSYLLPLQIVIALDIISIAAALYLLLGKRETSHGPYAFCAGIGISLVAVFGLAQPMLAQVPPCLGNTSARQLLDVAISLGVGAPVTSLVAFLVASRWLRPEGKKEGVNLVLRVYAPLHKDLNEIVIQMKMFRGLNKPQQDREEWRRIDRENLLYLVQQKFGKKLQDFYEQAHPSYVTLFSEARTLTTRIVMEDLTARGRIQRGTHVSIHRENGATETMTFESWLQQDARRFSEDVPVESIFMPIDRSIIPYESVPTYLERGYSRVQQVLELPATLIDYISELRSKAQGRRDVREMLQRQEELTSQAEELLSDLEKKAKA